MAVYLADCAGAPVGNPRWDPTQLVPPVPIKPRASKEGELNKWLSPRILTLQKSISTPSILAVKDGSTVALPQLSNSGKKDGANTGPTS
jgi:hypothetical protein